MAKSETKKGIKSWAEQDRPREKLLEKGPQALTETELLAILIKAGTAECNALELSRLVLQKANNSLNDLGRIGIKQMMTFKGIKKAKAITIAAALELGRRRKEEVLQEKWKITGSKSAYDYIYPYMADSEQEKFLLLLLNRSNSVIRKVDISIGGISGTVVDPKIIFKSALEELASSIILIHNHPSGNTKPSDADIKLTEKLVNAGKLLDIAVLDHLIFTNKGYFSFADEGMI